MAGRRQNQSGRVIDAMIAVAARYGYGGASVARVVKQAGVSRATFYEHFAGKEDCFLVAFRRLAQRVVREIYRVEEDRDVARRSREALGRLLESADRDPAAARVLLIESLAGESAVRAEHEQLVEKVERSIDEYFESMSMESRSLEIPARALLGGVSGVVASRVFRGETGWARRLHDDLLVWIDSYAVSDTSAREAGAVDWSAWGKELEALAEESLGTETLGRRLPRGRGALAPAMVAGEQRERILAAVARLSREKGYVAMTVADVVATAGVAREAFYERFRNKEDAFLATQAFGLEQSVSLTAGKFFGEEHWLDRVWNGVEAMLTYVAGQRDLVFVDLVESYAAGPAAIRRSFENRMAYTLFLEDGYRQRPGAEALPRICSEAIAGAIHELMRREVVEGRTEGMIALLPQVAYVTLAPFIGTEAALTLIERKTGRPTPRFPARPDGG